MTSFIRNLRAEILKTKRTSAFWIAFFGAGFIPLIVLIVYIVKNDKFKSLKIVDPAIWDNHMNNCWEATASFLMPMLVVMCSSLIAQLEVKNNAWKQVYATPISVTNIFFSKLVIVMGMVAFYFILYLGFCSLTPVIANVFIKDFGFLKSHYNIMRQIKHGTNFFILLMPIMALQFWMSMRFKNFMASIGIGMALVIAGLMLLRWEDVYLFPYVHTTLLERSADIEDPTKLLTFRNKLFTTSAIYTAVFIAGGYLDTLFRKER